MDEKLLEQIDRLIEAERDSLKHDIIKLIGVKSVKGPPMPGAPFGVGSKMMLDTVLEMGKA